MHFKTRIRRSLANRVASKGPSDRINRAVVDRAASLYNCQVVYGAKTIDIHRGSNVVRIAIAEMVHVPHIARDFDVFFSAVASEGDAELEIVDYSTPRIHRYHQLDLDLLVPSMQESIDVKAVYCPYTEPKAGDLVFDLGANIGVVSIWLSRLVGSAGSIVSFEPDPRNLECLEHSIAAAKASNIRPVPAALSASSGTALFFSEGSIGSGFRDLRADSMLPTTAGEQIEVQTLSVSDAFSKYGVPAWIKIDIEGAELEVLESGLDVLKETMPSLAIETDHLRGSETTARRIEKLLESVGYAVKSDRVGGAQMTWTLPQ